MSDAPIILFDGVCNLCNGAVQFIIKHDKNKQFQFASLQSKQGQELLRKYDLSTTDLDSFVLIHDGKAHKRSEGALRVARMLGGGWKLFYGFMIVPRFIRDGVYNIIGKNRYKWFGKRESCMIPTPELRARFLED